MKQHSKEYDDYIRSDQWQYKRAQRLQIAGNVCEMCGRPADRCRNGLQVHHIRYKDRDGNSLLGKEDVYKDLIVLCGGCHLKLHAYYDRVQSPQPKQN